MNDILLIIFRSLMSFFTLFILTRILGKKQIHQLTFLDYILGISIGTIAGSMTFDLNFSVWLYALCIATWFAAAYVLQHLTLKSRRVARYMDGTPTIIIANGRILDKAMKKTRLRLANLMEMLRNKDVFDISEVEYAIFETSGQLSVLKKSELLPLTPKDMNIPAVQKGITSPLIYDGEIDEHNLKANDVTKEWLLEQLKSQNINDPSEVFYASINIDGKIYIDKFEDDDHHDLPDL